MKRRGNQHPSEDRRTILFTGGGTGGHIYPGLAVLDVMPKGYDYLWIGSRKGMDRRIVEGSGVCFKAISSGKLRRYFSLKNIFDVFKILNAFLESLFLMARTRPKVLFSKGGYVSVPPVAAAAILHVPVVTHESDVVPGLATRINSRFAAKILVAYDTSRDYLPLSVRHKVATTGIPVRSEVMQGDADRGKRRLSLESSIPIILILGGSQGARTINAMILESIDDLLMDWNVIHQTGSSFVLDSVRRKRLSTKGYRAAPYFDNEYPDVLASADVVVCRAGATTLWELSATKKPSILLPLGLNASRGDQIQNARLFAEKGASYIFDAASGSKEELFGLLEGLKDRQKRLLMGEQAYSLYRADAAILIAKEIIESAAGVEI